MLEPARTKYEKALFDDEGGKFVRKINAIKSKYVSRQSRFPQTRRN